RQGYAYFFYTQEKLTSIQRQRLTALTEASRLGSGWEIARRDLEIRGTGNLLGAEQSGTAYDVGVGLYLEMVREAARNTSQAHTAETEIMLPLSAILPGHYIEDSDERTRWYSRLTRATSPSQLAAYAEELSQKFGPLPPEAQHFILLIRLQKTAGQCGITGIQSKTISPPDEAPYARLILVTHQTKDVLAKVHSLGGWEIRADGLSLDVDAITPDLIHRLLSALSKPDVL
ncbi:MAG: TRCF domain-containing protein, partial [Candidatus Binatia bacterium]